MAPRMAILDPTKEVVVNIVFLPATDPDDRNFGTIPERIEGHPEVDIHHVRFPVMVWYNKAVRDQALQQIDSLHLASMVVVGFSKSGLGAWNIARSIPEHVEATVIFDAPVASEKLLQWAVPYYTDNETWLADLPIRHVPDFKAAMPARHKLVLISGAQFHDEMSALSRALAAAGTEHVFLPRPHLKHHWNSGWIEEALGILRPAVRGV